MRLQKILQQAGVASRRTAAGVIAAGRVQVQGKVVLEPAYEVALDAMTSGAIEVLVDGKPLAVETQVLYAMHKPRDVICSMKQQGETPCIATLLNDIEQRVLPVGRLDKDVSGLLLLTNNGAFIDRLLHPRYEVPRKYWAVCRGTPAMLEKAQQQLNAGIILDDGPATARSLVALTETPEVVRLFRSIPYSSVIVELEVCEGRHHFVKRLMGALGLPVQQLARVAFGPYILGDLAIGEIREEKFASLG